VSRKAILWFRNNLRLKDNPSLTRAIRENDAILPVFVINENLMKVSDLGFKNCGEHRWRFLIESLHALKMALNEKGSDLLILLGDAVQELRKIAKKLEITDIYMSRELDHDELKQEEALNKDFQIHTAYDQLLIDPDTLPFEISRLPFVFTEFRKKVEKHLMIRNETRDPEKIATIPFDFDGSVKLDTPKLKIDIRSAFPFSGGENAAWQRIGDYYWEKGKIGTYKNTRNGLIGPDYSSKLSPYLALGCISPVSVYHETKRFEAEKKKNISTYWLIFEILWREFFKLTSWKYGNKIFMQKGINGDDRDFSYDAELFSEWITGRTADEFVNANMLELKNTGFMSNRGRQNVASFLAHDLNIDWRWGAAYFESQLIDYDCASNWCNWMYVAGVGNDTRNRKFNTKLQASKYDPQGKYQRLWLQPSLF
jgi:deoxyribodipyrimidine photo-lyase